MFMCFCLVVLGFSFICNISFAGFSNETRDPKYQINMILIIKTSDLRKIDFLMVGFLTL